MSPGRASCRSIGASSCGPAAASRCGGHARGGPPPARRASALDRRLAGRVDIGDQHDIGVVEAGAEAIEQMRQPGIAVRLHDGDYPAGAIDRAAFNTAAISTGWWP